MYAWDFNHLNPSLSKDFKWIYGQTPLSDLSVSIISSPFLCHDLITVFYILAGNLWKLDCLFHWYCCFTLVHGRENKNRQIKCFLSFLQFIHDHMQPTYLVYILYIHMVHDCKNLIIRVYCNIRLYCCLL